MRVTRTEVDFFSFIEPPEPDLMLGMDRFFDDDDLPPITGVVDEMIDSSSDLTSACASHVLSGSSLPVGEMAPSFVQL